MGFSFVDEILVDASTDHSTEPSTQISTDQTIDESESIGPLEVDEAIDTTKKTVFVGNVPLKVTTDKHLKKEFLKLFSPFGRISTYRFRSIALDQKYRRAGFLNQKFNSELKNSVNAYIVYDELDLKVLELNGKLWENHHLRVDDSNNPKALVPFRSVFLGNLPLDSTEEEIWTLFSEMGNVTNVRLVRDKMTLVGKGFGFVEFSDKGAVSLALKKKVVVKNREIRITSMKKNDSPAAKRLQKKNKNSIKKKPLKSFNRKNKK